MGGRHERAHFLVPGLDELGITLCPIQGAQESVDAITRVTVDAVDAPFGESVQDLVGNLGHAKEPSWRRCG